jgi:hypothetical protein
MTTTILINAVASIALTTVVALLAWSIAADTRARTGAVTAVPPRSGVCPVLGFAPA